jgi:hypothetical protein
MEMERRDRERLEALERVQEAGLGPGVLRQMTGVSRPTIRKFLGGQRVTASVVRAIQYGLDQMVRALGGQK